MQPIAFELEKTIKQPYTKDIAYLISTIWLNQLIDLLKSQPNIPFHMKPINQDIIDDTKSNIILYTNDIYNTYLKDNSNYYFISEQLWIQINSQYLGQSIKRYIIDQKINTIKQYQLLPIYINQKHFIQGIQQFDINWSINDIIQYLEDALQNQLSLQIPKNNFIKLYITQKQQFKSIIQQIQNKTIQLIELNDTQQLQDNIIIIMDIKQKNYDYYFTQFNKQLNQIEQIYELNEFSKKGFTIFENQNKLISCTLKCYETIEKIRNHIFNNNSQFPILKSLLQESYHAYNNLILYNEDNFEFLEEKQVIIKKSRFDSIFIYNNENRIIINNQKNIRQLIESLLWHPQLQCDINSLLFESSNEYYTQDIDYDAPTFNLKEECIYQIRKLMWQEQNLDNQDKIEIRVHRCIFEDIGYQQYTSFYPILKCFIGKQHKFRDLHLLIANLFEQINYEQYENNRLNQSYKLYFQTDQNQKQKCSLCQQKLCNNCLVPYNDKQIMLNNKIIHIYIVYDQIQQTLQKTQIQYFDQYILREYFEVDWAQDQILILNIDQTQIKPKKLKFYFDSRIYFINISDLYQLQGIIEKIDDNHYQSYCLIDNQWYLFNQDGYKQVQTPEDDINVIKLFYIRK